MQNNVLKVQEDRPWAEKVMIFLLQSTFFQNSESLCQWPIKLRTYQDKFPLYIKLKLEKMTDLTITKSY